MALIYVNRSRTPGPPAYATEGGESVPARRLGDSPRRLPPVISRHCVASPRERHESPVQRMLSVARASSQIAHSPAPGHSP